MNPPSAHHPLSTLTVPELNAYAYEHFPATLGEYYHRLVDTRFFSSVSRMVHEEGPLDAPRIRDHTYAFFLTDPKFVSRWGEAITRMRSQAAQHEVLFTDQYVHDWIYANACHAIESARRQKAKAANADD